MKTIDPFLRKPRSRVTVFLVQTVVFGIVGLLAYFAFFDPRAWAWIILSFCSIIFVAGYAFNTFVLNKKQAEAPLFVISRREYRKLLFPLNYYHLNDEQKTQKFQQRLRSLDEITSIWKIVKRELALASSLFLAVFLVSTTAFYLQMYFVFGAGNLSQGALLALDSVAKGALFDLLESFGISIPGADPRDSIGYGTISFVVRTLISVIVIREFFELYRAVEARRAYRRIFDDLNLTANFLFSLRFELQAWRKSLPKYYGVFPTVEDGIVAAMQLNWDQSGHSVSSESFDEVYEKFRHRTYKEALEIEYLDIALDYGALQQRAKDAEALEKLHTQAQSIVSEISQEQQKKTVDQQDTP